MDSEMRSKVIPLMLLISLLTAAPGCGHHAGGVDLREAIERDDGDAIRRYAAAGGSFDVKIGTAGRANISVPALSAAVKLDKPHAFAAMIECGADPDYNVNRLGTAMHSAVEKQDSWWVEKLIATGGDVNAVSNGGPRWQYRPIDIATQGNYDNAAIVRALLDAGASFERQKRDWNYPLEHAVMQNKFNIAIELLKRGANPRDTVTNGFTLREHLEDKKENHTSVDDIEGFWEFDRMLADRGL